MAKHKKKRKPKWVDPNPSAGKHGSTDKAADRVGRQWEKERRNNGEQ